MKLKLLPLLLLAFISFCASAQNLEKARLTSYYTFIYKITDEQAASLHTNTYKFETSGLRDVYDFFPTDSTYKKKLPVGHYVFVKAVSDRMEASLHSVNNVDIKLLNNQRDFSMIVYDSTGNEIPNGVVKINKREIDFDNETKTYRIVKSNRRGTVSINYKNHTSYFEIRRVSNNGSLRRIAIRTLNFLPIRIIASPVVYVTKNTLSLIRYQYVSRPRILQKRHRVNDGFMVFNKPRYKPGDTVRFKAYVIDHKGRPLKKTVKVRLNYKTVLDTISPFRNGAYQFEFKLVDSLDLRLDRSYPVEIVDMKGRVERSGNFQYEEYELKNNVYTARSDNRDGKPTALYLKGTDSNEMPLYDVRVEILLKPVVIDKFFSKQKFIPDTLWFHTTKLETIGETKIVIPDSVLRGVSMKYVAEVAFLNTENERTIKRLDLSAKGEQSLVSLELRKDSVWVLPVAHPKDDEKFVFETYRKDVNSLKQVTLPYREHVDYFAEFVSVSLNEKRTTLDLTKQPDLVQLEANRTKDSLTIVSQNPRKISLRYFLFRNQKLIDKGNAQTLNIKLATNKKDIYFLSVQYTWAGRVVSNDYNIPFRKDNLDISIDHAPLIYPGQTTTFTISVKDAEGKPVENVDLTAYAITRKFTEKAPKVPVLSKPIKQRSYVNSFKLSDVNPSFSNSLQHEHWRKKLGLDSLAYYNFRYPVSGYFENRVPAEVSQFAPFVVTPFNIETISLIYVDDNPVYFKNVSTIEPYSFAIEPGVHKIALRTMNSLITVNNVKVEPNQKLIFSIDPYKRAADVVVTKMPDHLSSVESSKLEKHFISFNPPYGSLTYIRQGERFHVYDQWRRGSYSDGNLSGPFFPGMVTYVQDTTVYDFRYQPFNRYDVDGYQQRIKDFNVYAALMKQHFYRYAPGKLSFADRTLTRQNIDEYLKKRKEKATNFKRFPSFDRRKSDVGRLQLVVKNSQLRNSPPRATFAVNLDNPDDYCVLPGLADGDPFNKGRYHVLVIFDDRTYIDADSVTIEQFGLNFYDLSENKLHEEDSLSRYVLRLINSWSQDKYYSTRMRENEMQSIRSLYYQQASAYNPYNHKVSGRITDKDGEPIPGVNVILKGTTLGTVSDLNGYYSLNCPPDGVLVFSFIGMKTEESSIEVRSIMNVELDSDVTQLSEVVVTGYAATEKRLLSASVSELSQGLQIRGSSSLYGSRSPDISLDSILTLLTGGRTIDRQTKPNRDQSILDKGIIDNVPGSALRKNFRDYAFWQPALISNEDGKATFSATFPDDITGWNAYVLGMGSKRKTGQASTNIQSYKPIAAQVAQPLFLIEGDKAVAMGKITNYMSNNLELSRTIKINEKEITTGILEVQNSKIDSIHLTATAGDSLKVEYSIIQGDYRDGELRKIPLFKKGTLVADGQFYTLHNDTTFTISVPEHDVVSLYAQNDAVDILLDEIDYLKKYEFECNEQLASKLTAYLLEKSIAIKRKKQFKGEREIRRIATKLSATQNKNGSWGWWSLGDGETWVTLHVAKSLMMAEGAGYKAALDDSKLIQYLEDKVTTGPVGDRLMVIDFLLGIGQKLEVKDFLENVKMSQDSQLHDKLLAMKCLQTMGQTPDWKWIDSLRSKTIKGNYYWGNPDADVRNNDILNTLIVFRMAEKAKLDRSEISKISNYFLEKKEKQWRNTYQSSQLIEALLPSFIERSVISEARLQLSGSLNRSVDKFPFSLTTSPGEMTITKSGGSPIYFTVYKQNWITEPTASAKDFVVTSRFEGNVSTLKSGKPVGLEVDVDVKADAGYVMIEVPIPAGCSYNLRSQPRLNGEVHREYFNHKVMIYCKYLKKGAYSYKISLLPRYTGEFTLNPARVECMYFPTLNGMTALRSVKID